MTTIYDVITIALFAGLAVLFLQRSTEPETQQDRIYHYAPPAIGCGLADWLGNQHQDILAVLTIAALAIYVIIVLKPFNQHL